jgi:hypothetical protein
VGHHPATRATANVGVKASRGRPTACSSRGAQALAPRARPLRTLLALVHAMRERGREEPTLDTGLVALAAGRTGGWGPLNRREVPA